MCLQEVTISLLERCSVHSWNNADPSETSCDGKQRPGAAPPSAILLCSNTLVHKAPFNSSFILHIYFFCFRSLLASSCISFPTLQQARLQTGPKQKLPSAGKKKKKNPGARFR